MLPSFERAACLLVIAEPLVDQPQVRPSPEVVALGEDQIFEQRAGLFGLPGLQVTEREVLRQRGVARKIADELFVDFDRTGVEAKPEIDHREKVLSFGVARLKLERLFELFLRFVDAVVLEQLAAAIQMKQEIFGGVGRSCAVSRLRWSSSVAGTTLHTSQG